MTSYDRLLDNLYEHEHDVVIMRREFSLIIKAVCALGFNPHGGEGLAAFLGEEMSQLRLLKGHQPNSDDLLDLREALREIGCPFVLDDERYILRAATQYIKKYNGDLRDQVAEMLWEALDDPTS